MSFAISSKLVNPLQEIETMFIIKATILHANGSVNVYVTDGGVSLSQRDALRYDDAALAVHDCAPGFRVVKLTPRS